MDDLIVNIATSMSPLFAYRTNNNDEYPQKVTTPSTTTSTKHLQHVFMFINMYACINEKACCH